MRGSGQFTTRAPSWIICPTNFRHNQLRRHTICTTEQRAPDRPACCSNARRTVCLAAKENRDVPQATLDSATAMHNTHLADGLSCGTPPLHPVSPRHQDAQRSTCQSSRLHGVLPRSTGRLRVGNIFSHNEQDFSGMHRLISSRTAWARWRYVCMALFDRNRFHKAPRCFLGQSSSLFALRKTSVFSSCIRQTYGNSVNSQSPR